MSRVYEYLAGGGRSLLVDSFKIIKSVAPAWNLENSRVIMFADPVKTKIETCKLLISSEFKRLYITSARSHNFASVSKFFVHTQPSRILENPLHRQWPIVSHRYQDTSPTLTAAAFWLEKSPSSQVRSSTSKQSAKRLRPILTTATRSYSRGRTGMFHPTTVALR